MPDDLSVWQERARRYAQQALDDIEDDTDPLPALSAATVCARAWCGEIKGDDLAELEQDFADPACICPPDLVARGGFRGGCPVHS